ncbi:MAG: hypothetical protein ACFFD3_04620 [Candidatus Thorarchaeota archaeon]
MIVPQLFAIVLFLLIPVVMYVLSFLIVKYSDENSPSRVRRWFHSARSPVELKSLSKGSIEQIPEEGRSGYISREVTLRLVAIYLVIGIFILSNIIGIYYHVMGDVLQTISNYGEEEIRLWSAIVYTTPFSGGWTGTFPWYGNGLWPLSYPETYHESWNWIFHTSALVTGNPYFFEGVAEDLIIIPLVFCIVILIPLARKSVREAFLPSLLHLHVSMLILASTLFNCFAEAFKLAILSNPITFGEYTVGAADLNGLPSQVIGVLMPLIFVVFLVYLGISYKLAQNHYNTSKKGKWIFVANTIVLYWLSFILAIVI